MAYKCPRCNLDGVSAAGIYTKETSKSEQSGEFLGSGAGIGSSGLGFGFMGGRYSGNKTVSTLRASLLAPPSLNLKFERHGLIFMLTGLSALILIYFLYVMVSDPDMGSSRFFTDLPTSNFILKVGIFSVIAFVISTISGFQMDKKNHEENEKIIEKYKESLDYYNTLNYCEKCNITYDENGNVNHIV